MKKIIFTALLCTFVLGGCKSVPAEEGLDRKSVV